MKFWLDFYWISIHIIVSLVKLSTWTSFSFIVLLCFQIRKCLFSLYRDNPWQDLLVWLTPVARNCPILVMPPVDYGSPYCNSGCSLISKLCFLYNNSGWSIARQKMNFNIIVCHNWCTFGFNPVIVSADSGIILGFCKAEEQSKLFEQVRCCILCDSL